MLGKNPPGYIIFTAGGRMMSIVEAEGRKVPQTDEESALALRTLLAYTGIFHRGGGKWTTKVDAAWNPAWNGTDQVRSFKLDGDRLEVTSAWG
jgi:lipocalin-like protein